MRILICAACGYQWNDDGTSSVFWEFCPVCDSNMVHEYAPHKPHEDHSDPVPWY